MLRDVIGLVDVYKKEKKRNKNSQPTDPTDPTNQPTKTNGPMYQLPLPQKDEGDAEQRGANAEGDEGGGDDDLLFCCLLFVVLGGLVVRCRQVRLVESHVPPCAWRRWASAYTYTHMYIFHITNTCLGWPVGEQHDDGGGDFGKEDEAGVLHLCGIGLGCGLNVVCC